jgi:uncharacterized protein (TIRG00374 family)
MQRRSMRLSLQLAVSLAVIMLLVWLVRQGDLVGELKKLRPDILALTAGFYLASALLASWRWQIFLRCRGIVEPWTRLAADYFLGMFCSTFLPTTVGGDAVRVYEVSRRGHSLRRVVLATFQDRLLGFGLMLALGLLAALRYLSRLPPSLAVGFFLLHVAGITAVVALLNPRMLLACCAWLGARVPGLHRLASSPRGVKVRESLRRLLDEPPLTSQDVLRLGVLGLASMLLCIGAHRVLARSLGIDISFLAFCLIVSLVWVVKLLPTTPNGLGVGEGAFVGLLGLFGAPAGTSLALALALLAIQMGTSLLGGPVALARVLRGGKPQVEEKVAVEGEQRHAA